MVLLFALALLLRLAFFGVSLARLPPTADECTNVLMARHIAKGERPLLFWGQPYQFPIEAYALAPLAGVMPSNAFGARYLFFAVSLVNLAGFLALLLRGRGLRRAWPAALLLLLPSAYWLMLQSAYYIPHYTTFTLFSWLLAWFVARSSDEARSAAFVALAGACAGLAYSTHLLIMPFALLCGIALCLGRSWRQAVRQTPAFLAGLAAGLVPYFLAVTQHPGAYAAVRNLRPFAKAIRLLWDPGLSLTLPAAMGVAPCTFPDFNERLAFGAGLAAPLAVAYALMLLAATVRRTWLFARRAARDRWPSLEATDLFAGVSWMALLLFVMSRRSDPTEYRYLLPAVFAFPFLLGDLLDGSPPLLRRVLACCAVLLAVFNLATSAALIREWTRPGFAAGSPDTPDIRSLLDQLKQRGVRACYASFWLAYRITHDTNERIVCAPPYNERFGGWPVPYKETVDAAPGACYVMTDTSGSRLKASALKRMLAQSGVTARETAIGPFVLFDRFAQPGAKGLSVVPSSEVVAATSHNPGEARRLNDDDPFSRWRSAAAQTTNMWIELRLAREHVLAGAALFYNGYRHDHAQALRIEAERNGEWQIVADGVRVAFDPVRFVNGAPRFGDTLQTIHFGPVPAKALRVRIAEITPPRCWSIGEIRLWSANDS